MILEANGSGKSTLVAVIRSLKSGNPDGIIGRRTLGPSGASAVELLVSNRSVRFDGAKWTGRLPNIAIFDNAFVDQNIHSGELVTIGNRRNLYEVIIGEEGVSLIKERERLSRESRKKTQEIRGAKNELEKCIPDWIG